MRPKTSNMILRQDLRLAWDRSSRNRIIIARITVVQIMKEYCTYSSYPSYGSAANKLSTVSYTGVIFDQHEFFVDLHHLE